MAKMGEEKLQTLLRRPFDVEVLKGRTGMDLYLCNPFRILALSAMASREDTENAQAKFSNRYGLIGEKALKKSACKLGYCRYGALQDPEGLIQQLSHPSKRLLNEVFWFHLPQPVVDRLNNGVTLSDASARTVIRQAFKSAAVQNQTLARHAVAIAYHTAAINNEIEYLLGRGEEDLRLWHQAHKYWQETLNDDAFWRHLKDRVQTLNDFRLKSTDIDDLKKAVPVVILSFNAVFASLCANLERHDDLKRHIRLVIHSGFAKHPVQAVIEKMAAARLEEELRPLISTVRQKLEGDKKISLTAMRGDIEHVKNRLQQAYEYWRSLKFSDALLRTTELDDLLQLIITWTNNKLDYQGSGVDKCLLYMMQLYNDLLELPISEARALSLNREMRKNRNIMYPPDKAPLPQDISPMNCWFIKNQPADPESSISISVYKITGSTMLGYGQYEIHSNSFKLLIPRSKLAKDYHDRKIKKEDIEKKLRERFAAESGEMTELQKEFDAIKARIQKKYEKQYNEAREKEQRELQSFLAEIARKTGLKEAQLLELEKKRLQEAKQIETKRKKAMKQVENAQGSELAAARRKLDRASSFWRKALWTTVCAVPGAVGAGLLALALTTDGSLNPAGIMENTIVLNWATAGAIAAGLIVIVAMQMDKIAAKRVCQKQEKAYNDAQKGVEADCAKLEREVEENLEKQAPGYLKALEQIKNRREEVQKKLQTFNSQLTAAMAKESDKETASIAKRIEQIKNSMDVNIKPQSYKDKFPALKSAYSNGYKQGTGPSQYEMQQYIG